jgi:hypothetical protein
MLLKLLFAVFILFEVFGQDIACQTGASTSDSDCTICLESNLNEKPIIILNCGHRFHAGCMAEWLHTARSCPLCRAGIDEESLIGFRNTRQHSARRGALGCREGSWQEGCCAGVACGTLGALLLLICFGA